MRKILKTVFHILGRELRSKRYQLSSSRLRLIEDLNMADWQILIIINKIESYFKIAIPDEEITGINTIKTLALVVAKHQGGWTN